MLLRNCFVILIAAICMYCVLSSHYKQNAFFSVLDCGEQVSQDSTLLHAEDIERNIWIYWEQGWENPPVLVQQCLVSWQKYNSKWTIHMLDSTSIPKYLPCLKLSHIPTVQARSDVLRVELLKEYGGVWVDATLFCTRPLDEWLGPYLDREVTMFTYRYKYSFLQSRISPISSWFLAAKKHTYLIEAFAKEVKIYWQNLDLPRKGYFWFHTIFHELIQKNPEAAEQWRCAHPNTLYPHIFHGYGMYNLSPEVIEDVNRQQTPCYKLNWKAHIYKDTNLAYLFYFHNGTPHTTWPSCPRFPKDMPGILSFLKK